MNTTVMYLYLFMCKHSFQFKEYFFSCFDRSSFSTDNVRTDWRVDRSTFRLAGHVVRSHSIVLKMK